MAFHRVESLRHARLSLLLLASFVWAQPAIAAKLAMIGDFTGESKGLATGIRLGLEAAFAGNPGVELQSYNHVYRPSKAIEEVEAATAAQPDAFIANVGTASLNSTFAALSKSELPLIGPINGADFLQESPHLISHRATFHQEADALVRQALANGMSANEICAFIQNDEEGYAGLRAIRDAIDGQPGAAAQVAGFDEVLAIKGRTSTRNNVGPVGTYKRYTLVSREGYESIKHWEEQSGHRCKLIMTSGVYTSISKFISYSRYKGEGWVVSAFSTVGMETLQKSFGEFKVDDQVTRRIVMTQVVPVFNYSLPIVREAMTKLKEDYGSLTLEGFIIGRLAQRLLQIARDEGVSLEQAALGRVIDLDGLILDFTQGRQGSRRVSLVTMQDGVWRPMDQSAWQKWAQ